MISVLFLKHTIRKKAFFLLARIDRTEQTKRALRGRDGHKAPLFVHGTTSFAFVAMFCREKKNWIVICFTCKASKGKVFIITCIG